MTTRHNRRIATEALAIQAAIGSVFDKDGQNHFRQMIERLNED